MSNFITIKLRRGTAAQWAATNPVLAEGEVGLETDTRKFKVGTGAAAWNSMQYWGGSGGGGAADFIDLGDVPPSYTGQGGKYVKVKTGEDGLEFGTLTVAIGDVTGLSSALANLVPYSGASGDVNLGEWGMQLGNIEFDITPTGIPTNQGSVYWDAAAETLAIVMNGTIQRVGEDLFYHVENQSGSSIAKGTAVRFAGTVGNSGKLLIAPFLADGSNPSSFFMGVASEAIANGASGRVQGFGKLRGIDTSSYAEGDILYCSTTVAGAFQTTAPVAPNNIVQVAAVVAASNNGTIFIRPTIGSNINSDEGVRITTPTNGQVLKYNSTSGLWENAADTAGVWGAITGTLSNQTDLQTALDGKVDENAAITPATKTKISYDAKGLVTAGADAAIADISGLQTALDGKVDENAAITPGTKTKITYDAKGLVTAGADATTADIADSTDKRYVTEAEKTKLSNLSGTNTGDQNLFRTIAVSGQSDVVADTTGDTLTLVAGSNVTITTDAATDSITISASGGGGGVSDGDKGDITVSSSGTVWTIDNSAVTLAKIQDITTARILGRITAGSGVTEELTGTQATTLLDTFTSSLKGLAPASGGGTSNFLRADGTWAVPPGTGGGGGGGADGTVLSPSQITAWQDNYNPSGWANTVGVLRINSNQFHFLSGLNATTDGHTVRIMNSGSFPIGLYNQNTDSTAGNRFAFDDHDVIILPGNSVELFYDGTDSRWRLAAGYALNENSPFVSRYWNEAFSTNQGEMGSTAAQWVSGGGYDATLVGSNFTGGRAGVIRCSTLTGTSTTAGYYLSNNESIEFNDGTGSGYQEFRAVMFSPADLADATNDYFIHAGFLDATSATPADGAWLRYNYNENSGQWQTVTGNAASRTTNNSAVALAASTWYTLRVVMYPNNTAEFYVNGVSVGRNTADLPGVSRDYSFGCYIRKTAGASARVIGIDGVGFTIVKYTK